MLVNELNVSCTWVMYRYCTVIVQSVVRHLLFNKILQYIKCLFDLFLAPCVEVNVRHVTCHFSYVHVYGFSSVGIATDYGLDGPGSNPGGDEIFRPSRPVLGPTQPPVQWIPGFSRG